MFDPSMFYNFNLLWLGLGALAPIIIHLAARSRPKPTPFPALRFILASHRRSSAKFRLKQLLLLLLRCCALALFAFIMARPLMKGAAAHVRRAKATVTAVILLDTSYSMGYRHEDGTTSLDRAKEMALAAVDAFAEGESRVCLLLVGSSPQPVISDFEHAYDMESLRQAIRDASLSHRGTDCAAAAREAVRMLDNVQGVGKSVFLFTDMTESSWRGAVPAGAQDDDITVYIADVGKPEPANLAVLGVNAPDNAATGAPLEVRARIDNRASADRRQVELFIDGDRRSQKRAGAQKVEELQLVTTVVKEESEHYGRVSLTEPDKLPTDNSYYFSFRSSPTIKILLVNGAPSPVARRDELYFLRIILAPEGMGGGQLFQASEVTAAALGTAQLRNADIVALCNVGRMSPATWTNIRNFVSTGRSLIVFGGENVTPANYDLVSEGKTALLPCVIKGHVTPAKRTRLEPGRLKHPILRVFRGGRNGDLASAKFTTYLKLEPNKDVPHDVVLTFKSGDPALVAGRYRTGRILLFASSCDRDWNTLPGELPYPVLVHECMKFLAVSKGERRDVLVGSSPDLRVSAPQTAGKVTLSRVGDDEGKATDVTERLEPRSGRLNLGAIEQPGVYRVDVERGTGRPTDKMFFAVNLDTAESNMARFREHEAVKSLFPGRKVKIASTPEDLLDKISRSESIAELSSHLAGVMLMILLAEMYLSNRMRARVESAEPEE